MQYICKSFARPAASSHSMQIVTRFLLWRIIPCESLPTPDATVLNLSRGRDIVRIAFILHKLALWPKAPPLMQVLPCSKRFCHDWTVCPYAHPGEKAKRRDPRVHSYTGIACPNMKKVGPQLLSSV